VTPIAEQPATTTSAAAARPVADRAMRWLAGLLIHVFFRHVELVGAEQLPDAGPVVVVANHSNGLVDGLLLIARLGRYPRFLGKSTLFRILPLKPFLRLAGVVPVHRVADGEGTDGNDRTFARCRELLGQGGVIAIFPEGISHDEASLQPLRTGAARIALGAAFDEHAPDVTVLPVGLLYDAKARFRSRALIDLGPPMHVDECATAYAADPHDAARALTARMRSALTEVGPDSVDPPAASSPTGSRAWSIVMIILLAPIALIGAVVHAVPYQLMKRVSRLPDSESIKSTVKLLGCAVLFFVEWVVLAVLAGFAWNAVAALAVLVGCPLSGYVTVWWAERVRDVRNART
jgi:1-acyl-sn-glycerol-3-phosphate acyltransferase